MSNDVQDRRDFITGIAVAAGALAVTACTQAAVSQTPAPRPLPPTTPAVPTQWGDAWATKLTAPHKAVFDAPEIADGTVVANAFVYMLGLRQVYHTPDNEMQPVLVIRHAAIPMAVDDAMWDKYRIGEFAKVKDGATRRWARRNPFLREAPDDPNSMPGASLEALQGRGAVLLGCSLALGHLGSQLAKRANQPVDAVRAELRAHLIPGLELAPNGVFAVMRAQEAGCTYIRSA